MVLIFNFSASYIGGGHKRMIEFVKYMNNYGGATFILNKNVERDVLNYNKNIYFFIKQSNISRLILGNYYLNRILSNYENIDFYYSYGIPFTKKIGKINWLHISNILPFYSHDYKIDLYQKIKFKYLKYLFDKSFKIVDYISAESNFSLSLISDFFKSKQVLSINGNDDELINNVNRIRENYAVVVGTLKYKALDETLLVFQKLKENNINLQLFIIGDKNNIPKSFSLIKDIKIFGLIERNKVINILRSAKYYISNTTIENSYNAASEGVFLANESFISDIPVHRELVIHSKFNIIEIKGCKNKILHIKSENLNISILKTWFDIINDMFIKIKLSNNESTK